MELPHGVGAAGGSSNHYYTKLPPTKCQLALNHHVPLDTSGRNRLRFGCAFSSARNSGGPTPPRGTNPTVLSIHPARSPPPCDPTTKIIAFNFRTSLEYGRFPSVSWCCRGAVRRFSPRHRQAQQLAHQRSPQCSKLQGLANMPIILMAESNPFRHQRQPVIRTKAVGKSVKRSCNSSGKEGIRKGVVGR
jgi:hypothetical protein